ncbi:MAG: AarF/ABC1/UbiB kinase family protein [Verrucomicrobiota bacterium]
MNLLALPQFKRNAKRFEQIVRVLAKYGLADFLHERDPDFISRQLKSAEGEELSKFTRAERVRMAVTELGTTFIKLGQMLSTRADLIGPELASELTQLQANTPPDSWETVRATIESELGESVDELFARFEEEPMGSASIAQAHRAELHDGQAVVVKVQHEGIEDTVVNDLEILVALAELAEQHSKELALYQPTVTLGDFRRNLMAELDFGREEQNLLKFRSNFERDATVHIPKPYPKYSAKRVLTMELLEGVPIAKTALLEAEGLDEKELASRGVTLYLEMIFRDRIYHADPHPGNILAMPGNVVGLLDFGMVGHLDDSTRESFEELIHAFLLKDGDLLTDCSLKLGVAPPDIDRDLLQSDLEQFVAVNLTGSLKDMDITRALGGFTDMVRRHRVVQKPGISLLIKVIVMLDGTGRILDPDFNLASLLQPYYKKMTERRLSPENLFRRVQKSVRDWDSLFQSLPRDLADIIRRVRRGTLDVHLEHRHLDTVINRLAFGIVTAALFLGSTLLWHAKIPPVLFGISLPGLAGVLFSLWQVWKLWRAIKKSGGL